MRSTPSGTSSFDRRLLLFPAVAFALFAAGNHNFGFDPSGWLDAFMYLGYFWHYPEHPAIFENYYKASRLPWILPGFAAHQLLGEIAGSYLLHWATLSAGGIAMYLLIRDTLQDRLVAAILGVAWVCSTSGHGIGGWNYQMLGAATYYLWGCWLVVRSAISGSGIAAVLTGAALTCAIHTHLFFLVFVPLLVPLYFVMRPAAPAWRQAGPAALQALAGGLGATVALGAINAATGGAWLFFMPQVHYTIGLSRSVNPWWFETQRWLPGALYLVIPALSVTAGALAFLHRRGSHRRVEAVLVLQGWAAFAVSCYYQFVARQSVLDHDYMAFGLYCHSFPAIAVAMHRERAPGEGRWPTAAVLGGATALILGSLLVGMPSRLQATLWPLQAALGQTPRIALPLIAGFAGVLLVTAVPRRVQVLAFSAWFAVLNVWVAGAPRSYGLGTPGMQQAMLRLFRQADGFTHAVDPSLGNIEYWFRSELVDTPQGVIDLAAVFDSYVSTRGWATNLLGGRSPGLPIDQLGPADVTGAICIGVLSSVEAHDAQRRQLIARLASHGHHLNQVATRRFEAPGLAFALTVLSPSPTAGGHPTAGDAHRQPCRP